MSGAPFDVLIILIDLIGICLLLVLRMSAHCILLIFIVKTVINQINLIQIYLFLSQNPLYFIDIFSLIIIKLKNLYAILPIIKLV